ncbi:hypothetical protein Bhyg_04395 [Pseudolycoriella hygida]|uniref:Uncharacterized protein n=1 Tax=Pseudolycoriella hygida TaxID=35572 RepID=A0A9Q0S8E6_9DIPT|nr:hypothetical protein Bhyg_04395 [Pseudolycoriella hygida]
MRICKKVLPGLGSENNYNNPDNPNPPNSSLYSYFVVEKGDKMDNINSSETKTYILNYAPCYHMTGVNFQRLRLATAVKSDRVPPHHRERLENTERQLNEFIAESFQRHLTLIMSFINTTNEIHTFIDQAGKDLRVNKTRQMLHKTDLQCHEIIQQFGWMFKYIDEKLMQADCINVAAIKDYENQLLNLQLSLNNCEFHKKNKKPANLVRKIRIRINSLIEKIKSIEKKAPDYTHQAINAALNSEFVVDDEEECEDGDDSVFYRNC